MHSKIEARREGVRKLILREMHRRGGCGTVVEVAAALGLATKHVGPRFTELAAARQITDTGRRKATKGRPQVVWIDQSRFRPADNLPTPGTTVTPPPPISEPSWFNSYGN